MPKAEQQKKKKRLPIPVLKKIRRFFTRKVLDGNNTGIDRAFFRFFDSVNELTKSLATKKGRDVVSKLMMGYLLEVVPGYESAQPLLGSTEEENAYQLNN